MGVPALDPTQRSVVVTFKAPESFAGEIAEAADALSMQKSTMIREALRQYIDAQEARLSA